MIGRRRGGRGLAGAASGIASIGVVVILARVLVRRASGRRNRVLRVLRDGEIVRFHAVFRGGPVLREARQAGDDDHVIVGRHVMRGYQRRPLPPLQAQLMEVALSYPIGGCILGRGLKLPHRVINKSLPTEETNLTENYIRSRLATTKCCYERRWT